MDLPIAIRIAFSMEYYCPLVAKKNTVKITVYKTNNFSVLLHSSKT